MAPTEDNLVRRSFARLRKMFGISNSGEISDSRPTKEESLHYGMFTENELRHVEYIDFSHGTLQGAGYKKAKADTITTYLSDVAANTRKKIDELKNLKILAPEIEQAKAIIISSIISPQDLQTDSVKIEVDNPGLTPKLNGMISEYLTNFFNDEFHLGPKLIEWLGTAGFDEGAKPILVLPKNQLDLLNYVADKWNPEDYQKYQEMLRSRNKVSVASEGLLGSLTKDQKTQALESFTEVIKAKLELGNIGKEFLDKAAIESLKENQNIQEKDLISSEDMSKLIAETSLNLLMNSGTDAITISDDMSQLGNAERSLSAAAKKMELQAARQVSGYEPGKAYSSGTVPMFTVADIQDIDKHDMPIVIEFPSDSVIPVCSPSDNKNHIGYFVLLDENGRPIRGQYSFFGASTPDVNDRLARNAAKAVYGSSTIATYMSAGMTSAQSIDQLTQVFSVAINNLISAKLTKDGLTGLNVNVHEAVGKAIFYNLLAKNRIRMVFVPANMMIYYRFDHREDGTGKTFLENIAFILCLRSTLTIAKIMAAVDNATKHRKIEVNIDEKNNNPIETMELVRQAFLNKKAPTFPTDPTTAAENIINSHLTITPRGLAGNTDDLSITTETSYGQSQAPDDGIMDNLNNWIGMGLKIPPSALNQLSEAEYSRSVATSNLFFSNAVRNWQNIIRPFNKQFVINYITSDYKILQDMKNMIEDDHKASYGANRNAHVVDPKDQPPEGEKNESPDVENDDDIDTILKRTIATAEVVLAPPNVAANKAHYEEVQSMVDAMDKVLQTIYPDDIAPNDELRSTLSTIRALVSSNALREFLPKLGFHELATVPNIEEIDDQVSIDVLKRLNELKRRADSISKFVSGQLPAKSGGDAPAGEGGDTGDVGGDGDSAPPGDGTGGDDNPENW